MFVRSGTLGTNIDNTYVISPQKSNLETENSIFLLHFQTILICSVFGLSLIQGISCVAEIRPGHCF